MLKHNRTAIVIALLQNKFQKLKLPNDTTTADSKTFPQNHNTESMRK